MRLDPRADESDIASQAMICVGKVRAHVGAFGRNATGPQTLQELNGTLNGIAALYGARTIDDSISLGGRIGRMVDPFWWRRNLRRELLRENETIERAAGHVRRKGQCYVSDFGVRHKAQRAKINRRTLENLEVVNETGQALNLAEVSDKSVSNPKLRSAELMTRCRGFEEAAKFMGHDAVFLTITCPSRFHKFSGARDNKKWHGETTKDAQAYLSGMWKKIRAAYHRAGFFPYGFRVTEPNHDGCVHWHILLFIAPEHKGWFQVDRFVAGRKDHGAGLIGIVGKYALQESPSERGAAKARFTAINIDPSKGSPTSYITKYICKNIDGMKSDGDVMGLDFDSGKSTKEASVRVRTWAQINGIRQFQQIGGPSVTVWRELRRLGDTQVQNDLFEGPRAAADRGMWALFWILQGGPEVPRKELTLKPAYMSDSLGKYGDEVKRVWGVTAKTDAGDVGLQTKLHTWTIQRAGLADVNFHEAVRIDDRAVQAGADAWAVAHGFDSVSEFREQGEAFSPWTSVNNCTQGDEIDDAEAVKLDAQRGAGIKFQGGEGKPTFGIYKNEQEHRHRSQIEGFSTGNSQQSGSPGSYRGQH